MPDQRSFETRLEATFGHLVAAAPVDDDPRDLALGAMGAAAGRRWGSASTLRLALLAAALVALLVGLLAIGLLAGGMRESPLERAVVASVSPASSAAVASPGIPAAPIPVLPGEPWIAYMASIAGADADRVWLVRPDGRDRHQLVTGLDGQQEHPDWSPDGTRLVFDRWYKDPARPGMDLVDDWVMNADGSGARRVAWCGSPCAQLGYPSWSPDGSQLVVSRFDELVGDQWGPSAIEIVDVATGDRRAAFVSPDGSQAFHSPRWSPDGSQIAFVLETYADPTETALVSTVVAIVGADGSTEAPVIVTPPELGAAGPDWSPDGASIAFGAGFNPNDGEDRTTPTEIYTVSPDGSDLRKVTDFGLGTQRGIEPTWTSDGAGFVFTLIDGFGSAQIPAIALMNADGSGIQRLGFASGTAGRLRPTP